MKTKLLLLLLLAGSASLTFAQSNQRFTGQLNATCASATAACSTAGASLLVSTGNYNTATITVNGTYAGSTINFEFSDDGGTVWYPDFCSRTDITQQVLSEVLPSNQTRAYQCNIFGESNFRVRQSAWSSGLVLVAVTLGSAPTPVAQTVALGSQSAPAQSVTGSAQTPITASATGAASAANSALAAVANKTTYITGFQVTGGGATGASIISVTVTGTITGTMNYNIPVPAGATLGITPLVVSFPIPIPASAVNTAITVNVPSFGAGNTTSASAAQGFQQ